MTLHSRRWLAALAAGTLTAGAPTAGALTAGAPTISLGAATAAATRPLGAAIGWRPCPDAPAADCATLRVPVDWAHPEGATTDLALARRRATDPARRIGSLLINTGGPGGSGVADIIDDSSDFSALVRARFDLVSWDPRGFGLSHPVQCDPELLAHPVSRYPTDRSGFAALIRYNRALMTSCRSATGPLFDHLDTGSTARDVEAIRAALGEDRLTFSGLSYGTLIGEQYAELFPGRIRAMALDSDEDHSVGATRAAVRLSRALEGSFDQFAEWCGRTPACALYPHDPRAALDRVYARASRGTLYVPGAPDQRVTVEDLAGALRGELTGVGGWPSLAQNLRTIDEEPAVTQRPQPGPVEPWSAEEAAKTAVICEDHAWNVAGFADLSRLREAMRRTAPHTRLSSTAIQDVTGCLGFPGPVPNPQHRLVVRGAPALLMVNSRYDVATPYPGAVDAGRQIGRSAVLLTYDGASHADYAETSCVRAAVDAYLISLRAPGPGAHCPAIFPA
ncbi:alpha/beta fold hydrolase [Plantactinospora siamensis]|uniref:Alpha/beta fold hydrolase n=1 Tax=Plantactinospora siamensis TaxID=555372 RepID=A0ABV6NSD8_9ACTN